jgi:hypothetical protein
VLHQQQIGLEFVGQLVNSFVKVIRLHKQRRAVQRCPLQIGDGLLFGSEKQLRMKNGVNFFLQFFQPGSFRLGDERPVGPRGGQSQRRADVLGSGLTQA